MSLTGDEKMAWYPVSDWDCYAHINYAADTFIQASDFNYLALIGYVNSGSLPFFNYSYKIDNVKFCTYLESK